MTPAARTAARSAAALALLAGAVLGTAATASAGATPDAAHTARTASAGALPKTEARAALTKTGLLLERYAARHDGTYPTRRVANAIIKSSIPRRTDFYYLTGEAHKSSCTLIGPVRNTTGGWGEVMFYDTGAPGTGIYATSRRSQSPEGAICFDLIKDIDRANALSRTVWTVGYQLRDEPAETRPTTLAELDDYWDTHAGDMLPLRNPHVSAASYDVDENGVMRVCLVDDRGGWATWRSDTATRRSNPYGTACTFPADADRRFTIAIAKQLVTAVAAYGQQNDLTAAQVLESASLKDIGFDEDFYVSPVAPVTYTSYSTDQTIAVAKAVTVYGGTTSDAAHHCTLNVAGELPVLIMDSCV